MRFQYKIFYLLLLTYVLKFWQKCLLRVKKRCRLTWLTNSALVYDPMRVRSCGVSANVQLCTRAQINFGDQTLCREPELPGGWAEKRGGGWGGGRGAEASCQYSPPHPGWQGIQGLHPLPRTLSQQVPGISHLPVLTDQPVCYYYSAVNLSFISCFFAHPHGKYL